MQITVPDHSSIRIETSQSGFPMLALPKARAGVMRYAVSAFLIFWLCGWTAGWFSAFNQIISGGKAATPFLIFWLCGWTVGGFFAAFFLWGLLRPGIPETLTFSKPELVYDSGIQPLPLDVNRHSQKDMWKKLFEKRRSISFSSAEIATMRLRDTESDNRLTIDHGPERVTIGRTLTEVEREWLFKLITDEYQISGDA